MLIVILPDEGPPEAPTDSASTGSSSVSALSGCGIHFLVASFRLVSASKGSAMAWPRKRHERQGHLVPWRSCRIGAGVQTHLL